MEKKLRNLFLLLLILFCVGCKNTAENAPADSTPTPTVSPTAVPEPVWLDDSHTIYKLYELKDAFAYPEILCWNDQTLILESREGTLDLYTLDPHTGEKLLECGHTFSGNCTVLGTVDGRLYIYDSSDSILTILKNYLTVDNRRSLPHGSSEIPLFDPQGEYYYYVDQNSSVWKQSLKTSEKILMKSSLMPEMGIYADTLLFSGEILKVTGLKETEYSMDPAFFTEFLDTSTGEPVLTQEISAMINTSGNRYQAVYYDKINQLLYGTKGSDSIQELILSHSDEYESICLNPEENIVLTQYTVRDETSSDYGQVILSLYDLETGTKAYETSFVAPRDYDNTIYSPSSLTYFPKNHQVIFQISTPEHASLYVWDLTARESISHDLTVYTEAYTPQTNQEDDRLNELRKSAYTISERYGVKIYLGDDCGTDFGDYTTVPMYHTRLVEETLDSLEKCLSSYPEGFFRQLGEGDCGPLKIYICGTLSRATDEGITDAVGIYNGTSYNQYMVIDASNWGGLEQAFYHEITHAIDFHLYGDGFNSYADSSWLSLNPDGFTYDYSYTEYENDADYSYTFENDAYFIDAYSKTYPTEDRARILEYAMTFPSDEIFKSIHLQNKLRYICEEIRKGFNTEGWPDTALWEKPLDNS